SFNIERELGRNRVIEIGYLGSKGTSLDQRRWLNQAVPDANPTKPTAIITRTRYPAFANALDFYDHTGFSIYEAFTARFEQRLSRGLNLLAAYTFSKSIDNSSFAGGISPEPAEPQNSYALAAERGLSYFDSPNRLVTSLIYQIPV